MPDHAQACIELFNGKDFTGWKTVMKDNTESEKGVECGKRRHQVSRQTQRLHPHRAGYRDYKVMVEWRFTKAATRAFWSTCTSRQSLAAMLRVQACTIGREISGSGAAPIARNRKFPQERDRDGRTSNERRR